KILQRSTAPELKHILNEFTGNFTNFELQEMTQLKSTSAKNMCRILKQYKHTGYFTIGMDDLIERLDIPKTYKIKYNNKQEFKPIINELG
ncbi:replication initiation protein, partial [Staphylococcus saprophyticus]|uniref:replication initiation protein n=1 Tax=Staphylococcus saprophyticus TaxID=29385 RepID=UPI00289C60C3